MFTFDPDEPVEAVAARASAEATTLTEFFKTNNLHGKKGGEAQKLTYQEFPQKFVWQKTNKTWSLRQRDFALGVIGSPGDGSRDRSDQVMD